MSDLFYTVVNHKDYPDDGTCQSVVWKNDFFMPFDILKGLDSCPPDNRNYKRNAKKHWWVCPITKRDYYSIHDISMFIEMPHVEEFTNLDKAVKYCMKWRSQWLKKQLSMKQIKKEVEQST